MEIKELIRDRLHQMEDLAERKQLRDVLTHVFLQLAEHHETFHDQLQQRIFQEVEVESDQFDLYTTICQRGDIDPQHDYLFPMLLQDIEPSIWDLNELKGVSSEQGSVKLLTLFLGCDYLVIQELLDTRRKFKGMIMTNFREIEITVFLQQNQDYLLEIEKLYQIFLQNDVPWRTVHHPYLNKFFDVMIHGLDASLFQEKEAIQSVSVYLEEFEQYKLTDIVPLWNVRRIQIKNVVFPVPAQDRINFEHVLSLRKLGLDHGYLIEDDPQYILYVKRSEDELTIVSPVDRGRKWEMLQLAKPIFSPMDRHEFEVVSNRKNQTFLNHFARKYSNTIRTSAEVSRLVYSFREGELFHVVDIELCDPGFAQKETYPLNGFIFDNIRDEEVKRILAITFRYDGEKNMITRDRMSFIVAEVGRYFPEFECVGILQ